MINLNSVKRVHFIGIAGVGMQAIANIFIDKGYSVSGSDMKATAVTENFAARARASVSDKEPKISVTLKSSLFLRQSARRMKS